MRVAKVKRCDKPACAADRLRSYLHPLQYANDETDFSPPFGTVLQSTFFTCHMPLARILLATASAARAPPTVTRLPTYEDYGAFYTRNTLRNAENGYYEHDAADVSGWGSDTGQQLLY